MKKLLLKKEVVASLERNTMQSLKGGFGGVGVSSPCLVTDEGCSAKCEFSNDGTCVCPVIQTQEPNCVKSQDTICITKAICQDYTKTCPESKDPPYCYIWHITENC